MTREDKKTTVSISVIYALSVIGIMTSVLLLINLGAWMIG